MVSCFSRGLRGGDAHAAAPSEDEILASLWNLARLGRSERYSNLRLRFDATTVAAARAEVESLLTCTEPSTAPQVLNPLIIEPSGRIVPLVFGMPRSLELGQLGDGSLETLTRQWYSERLGGFVALCRRALDAVASMAPDRLINWPALVRACAEEQQQERGALRLASIATRVASRGDSPSTSWRRDN
jgi:hypothetical protein